DKRLRRAGLDYHEYAELQVHPTLEACLANLPGRVFAFTKFASRLYTEPAYRRDDVLLFGRETTGLPAGLKDRLGRERCLRLPMQPESRSLNLSNSVAVAVYEAWRQLGFASAADGEAGIPS